MHIRVKAYISREDKYFQSMSGLFLERDGGRARKTVEFGVYSLMYTVTAGSERESL